MYFLTAAAEWRCTDVGTRTIVAIRLNDHSDDPSWFNGPPYAVVEHVLDENDLPGTKRMRKLAHPVSLLADASLASLIQGKGEVWKDIAGKTDDAIRVWFALRGFEVKDNDLPKVREAAERHLKASERYSKASKG